MPQSSLSTAHCHLAYAALPFLPWQMPTFSFFSPFYDHTPASSCTFHPGFSRVDDLLDSHWPSMSPREPRLIRIVSDARTDVRINRFHEQDAVAVEATSNSTALFSLSLFFQRMPRVALPSRLVSMKMLTRLLVKSRQPGLYRGKN